MLIGGDDTSNKVVSIGTCFRVFFNVCLHSGSFPIRADWRRSDSSVDGQLQGNWTQNSIPKDVVASSPSFPTPPPERPGELARRLINLSLCLFEEGELGRY